MTKGIHSKISNQFNEDEVLIDVTGFQNDYFGQTFSRPVVLLRVSMSVCLVFESSILQKVSIDALVMLTFLHLNRQKNQFSMCVDRIFIYKQVPMCVDRIYNIPSWCYNIINPSNNFSLESVMEHSIRTRRSNSFNWSFNPYFYSLNA